MLVRSQLTLRYAIALLLIACVMAGSYVILIKQIERNTQDGYVINTSGKQRMLSQRIALLSHELYDAKTEEEAALLAERMEKAVERMTQNHEVLTSGRTPDGENFELSPTIKTLYFAPDGVDPMVTHYLEQARTFLTLYHQEGYKSPALPPLSENIVDISQQGMLEELNTVVSQYQKEATEKIDEFERLERLVLIIGLLLLAIEVLTIFRPMVQTVADTIHSLKQSNAELLEFAYRMSHDIRAPVASSLGLVGILKTSVDEKDDATTRQSIDYIEKSLEKMDQLIEDIVTLTKTKQARVAIETVDLDNVITGCIQRLSTLPSFDKVQITRSIAITRPIKVRKIFLQQALENLISNGIKYHNPKQENPLLHIRAYTTKTHYVVEVSDNGLGIPAGQQSEIFGMFKRFHPKISYGSGLGLYLVKQNAEALEGDVSYKTLAEGSCFILRFSTQPTE